MTREVEIGVVYALLAGVFGASGRSFSSAACAKQASCAATLTHQFVAVLCVALLTAFRGELFRFDLSVRAFWGFFLPGALGTSFGKIFYYKGIDKVGASKSTSVKNSSPSLRRFWPRSYSAKR